MDFEKVIGIVLKTKDIILNHSFNITTKGLADFVTDIDINVQNYIKSMLESEYPDIQFVGEEGKNDEVNYSQSVWILDPVDGTTNLIHDFKMSAVSLALYKSGKGEAGIVYNPFNDELFTAQRGKGAYLNGKPIRVSEVSSIQEGLISIGTSPYDKKFADRNFEIFKKIFVNAQDIRRTGSAAIDLCYAACGRIDGYFERNLKPWDFAAGAVILEEAGGKISNFNDGEIDISKNNNIIAGNGLVNDELRDIICEFYTSE